MPSTFRLASIRRDPEIALTVALLCAVLVIGLASVGDYGITTDEFNADDYGRFALAWYKSGFSDRTMFTDVEETLWYYGPWFHMLVAAVQALALAAHYTVRHALTFVFGLAAIAMLLPMGRIAVGRWAGLAAITLCVTTGYLYGSLFFTPIDVPFMFAMTAATLAIMVMAGRSVPSWPAALTAGLLTGLATATRSSGFITQAYLVGAMLLCAAEILLAKRAGRQRELSQLVVRSGAALAAGWVLAFCIWPWLQVGNPVTQFVEAFRYFANHPASWDFPHWGGSVTSNQLPASYVPAQLAARLPLAFLIFLVLGMCCGIYAAVGELRRSWTGISHTKTRDSSLEALFAAPARQALVLWGAALSPILFVIVDHSTLYNGIRHVLFVIPMLALIAASGFAWILPWLVRVPILSGVALGGYLGWQVYVLAALHPLEYVDMNALGGGVRGAYGRFELDYWASASTVALRRLEQRMDLEKRTDAPRLMICVPWREPYVKPMWGRAWTLETEAAKADYVIAAEPSSACAKGANLQLIDEVTRLGQAFAWTYARMPEDAAPSPPPR
jgi:hypothetical protein